MHLHKGQIYPCRFSCNVVFTRVDNRNTHEDRCHGLESFPGPGSRLRSLQRSLTRHKIPEIKSQSDQATRPVVVTDPVSLNPVGETLSFDASGVGPEDDSAFFSESSFSDDMMSSESDPSNPCSADYYHAMLSDWAAYGTILLPLQDKIFAGLMEQVSYQIPTAHSPDTQSSAAAGKGEYDSFTSQQKVKDRKGSDKRSKGLGNSGSGSGKGGDDEEGDKDQQRPRVKSQPGEDTSPYFACHFAKYNPLCYSKCVHLRFQDVSRVKHHLRVKHLRPIQCAVCNKVFRGHQAEQEFEVHQRARSCTEQQQCPVNGITEAQKKEINRRIGQRKGRTEIEKWYTIWEVIFSAGPRPNSPFNDGVVESVVLHYHRYMLQSLPAITEDITSRLPEDHQGLSIDQITSIVLSWYPEFLRRVHERWLLSRQGSSPEHRTSSSISGSPDGDLYNVPASIPTPSGNVASDSASNLGNGNLDILDQFPHNHANTYEQPGPSYVPRYAAPLPETTQETHAYDSQSTHTLFPTLELSDTLGPAASLYYQSPSHPPGSPAPEEQQLSRQEFIEMLRYTSDADFLRCHVGNSSRLEMIDHLCQIDDAEYADTCASER